MSYWPVALPSFYGPNAMPTSTSVLLRLNHFLAKTWTLSATENRAVAIRQALNAKTTLNPGIDPSPNS